MRRSLAWVALALTCLSPGASGQEIADHVELYGSLRFRSGFETGGSFEINDKASRVGLRGELPMGSGFTAFAQAEMGLNIVKSPGQFVFSGDPGYAIGEDQDAVTTRLGVIGVRHGRGAVSWGKQWSPFYDVGEMTDRFAIFGGEAQGSFNFADGDPSGTGRAGSSFQYRWIDDRLDFAVQVQNRTTSAADRNFADSFGGSLTFSATSALRLGAAFNTVRDGVAVPTPGSAEVAEGDRAFTAGAEFTPEGWTVSVTGSSSQNHHADDGGAYFDGTGVELYVHRDVTDRVRVVGGVNHLAPEGTHPGDFRLTYGVVGASLGFPSGRAFLEVKLEDSRASTGDRSRPSVFGFGMRFDF